MASTPRTVSFPGRVLFLTEDPALLEAQLARRGPRACDPRARRCSATSRPTRSRPAGFATTTTRRSAGTASSGLRGGKVAARRDQERRLLVIVSGISQGLRLARARRRRTASSTAGVQLVIARSIEKIYRQNAQNIGLLTSTDFGARRRASARGEAIPIERVHPAGSTRSAPAIVEHGGPLRLQQGAPRRARSSPPAIDDAGAPDDPVREDPRRATPSSTRRAGTLGVPAVKPGDAFFARTDVRFSHEYVTPMAESLFRAGLRRGREGDRARERLRLPRPPHVPRPRHAQGAQRHGPRRAGAQARDGAGRASRSSTGIKLYGEVHRDGKLVGLARPSATTR